MKSPNATNNKETLFSEIKNLKKLIFDIESESIHNFQPDVILNILKKVLSEKEEIYFA